MLPLHQSISRGVPTILGLRKISSLKSTAAYPPNNKSPSGAFKSNRGSQSKSRLAERHQDDSSKNRHRGTKMMELETVSSLQVVFPKPRLTSQKPCSICIGATPAENIRVSRGVPGTCKNFDIESRPRRTRDSGTCKNFEMAKNTFSPKLPREPNRGPRARTRFKNVGSPKLPQV